MLLRRINLGYGIVCRFIIKTPKLSFTGIFRNLFCYSSGKGGLSRFSPSLLLVSLASPSLPAIHINETNTPVSNDYYFYTFVEPNRRALLFLFITLEKYLVPSRPRGPFNLYGTQFRSSTKGVISFGLMARKKFQRAREAGQPVYSARVCSRARTFLPDNTWKGRL